MNIFLAGAAAVGIAVTVLIVFYAQGNAAIGLSLLVIAVVVILSGLLFLSLIFVGPKERSIFVVIPVLIVSIGCVIVLFGCSESWLGLKNTAQTTATTCETNPVPMPEAIYFSVVTWTTLGYGDLVPCPATRGVAAAEALIATLVMALLIAALVEGIQKITSRASPPPQSGADKNGRL